MPEYKNYLAAGILAEDKVITYRLLSRALKVHVNAAKEMLFEFHRQQNAKKPGTVHATYLLSGLKQEEREPTPTPIIKKDGEDDYMQSSPFMSSSMPQPVEEPISIPITTVALVREENLEDVKSQYESITSIHIYSLGPHPLKDLQLLSDSTREIQTLTATEDPLEHASTYGTILNPLVRHRPNRRPPGIPPRQPPIVSAKVKPAESSKEAPKAAAAKATSSTKQDGRGSQSAAARDFFGKSKEKAKAATDSAPSSKESTPAPPVKLKKESSSIFKSFAKAKPKLERENTDSAAEDVPMMDDDDDEDEGYVPPIPVKKEKAEDNEEAEGDRKSRKEREAALRKMMEDDDEEEEAVPTPPPEEEETILEDIKPVKEEEPVVTVSDGRRRGKRRVMKKKTIKDEEGYLGMCCVGIF
ncbi:DNA polymerase subunit Cdc27 [Bisporella sp. PMI_857]|nr:DNA polymerase subunit Cdc27 [Bisporella sp. PMI_857]